jgi:hypothetical protein
MESHGAIWEQADWRSRLPPRRPVYPGNPRSAPDGSLRTPNGPHRSDDWPHRSND